ncbi:acyl-CoA thioesterase II [Haliea sp.]|uniref:acyl-CoA thioesterase n=1 Tax=Haliea TaxID=475794 RepID=UPI000C64C947|nr:acyl-CoA thioesterase II [Haliea sp.]MAD62815.1 acyl-CoA thioesterase II [Haliea sp.]MAY94357.1 acyl-CoA thioesterase II [Haliea sp.]MBP69698.1 acyl-CoA thioesterase II [Haliea sp.]HCD55376.1 acyl-CoA thioesterase II [Halieaceae bacterium]
MTDKLQKLLTLLEVERIDKYLFIGNSPSYPPRVFGGQVLAQSLNAASRTVDAERFAHSMHAYFLRPGNPKKQIVYEVDPIRDGGSFTTRRVTAKQDGIPIFSTSVSFQTQEDGFSHQFEMPEVTPPEELETDFEFWSQMAKQHPERFAAPMIQALERRPVKRRDYFNPQPQEPEQYTWFRVLDPEQVIGDDPVRHQTILTFISDFALLGAALLPHPVTAMDPQMQTASLDHALWIHRPLRVDDYLLYAMDSPSTHGGRGLSRGSFYNRQGDLVASTAQESLLRRKRPVSDT